MGSLALFLGLASGAAVVVRDMRHRALIRRQHDALKAREFNAHRVCETCEGHETHNEGCAYRALLDLAAP